VRLLQRVTEPAVLQKHGARWATEFVGSEERRPRPSRYRHEDVVEALRGMSHGKCFYCERVLEEGDEQVDHYVDVACDRGSAFAWGNLYLSCKDCNEGKPSHVDIPVTSCVDPCGAVAVEQHLEFVQDQVRPAEESALGEPTIRKYRLLRRPLVHQRMQVLKNLWLDYQAMLKDCLARGAKSLDPMQRTRLRAYAAPTAPFSACCRAWLVAEGLW
jgi:uncharacterized protein (TIGR02646 family)